ncbi:hypothetical protein ACFE04_019432 [Oxalis oulophora]
MNFISQSGPRDSAPLAFSFALLSNFAPGANFALCMNKLWFVLGRLRSIRETDITRIFPNIIFLCSRSSEYGVGLCSVQLKRSSIEKRIGEWVPSIADGTGKPTFDHNSGSFLVQNVSLLSNRNGLGTSRTVASITDLSQKILFFLTYRARRDAKASRRPTAEHHTLNIWVARDPEMNSRGTKP